MCVCVCVCVCVGGGGPFASRPGDVLRDRDRQPGPHLPVVRERGAHPGSHFGLVHHGRLHPRHERRELYRHGLEPAGERIQPADRPHGGLLPDPHGPACERDGQRREYRHLHGRRHGSSGPGLPVVPGRDRHPGSHVGHLHHGRRDRRHERRELYRHRDQRVGERHQLPGRPHRQCGGSGHHRATRQRHRHRARHRHVHRDRHRHSGPHLPVEPGRYRPSREPPPPRTPPRPRPWP